MSDFHLPPVRPYHPATFLERGVAVPFTTPLLAGTRARPAEKQGLELIIPNPSGGRGVYIMVWTGISALCSPTLHDRQLSERIATLTGVTPNAIRRIAREIAAEGFAGEEARDAARAAAEHDKGERLVINYLLLVALMEQFDKASGTRASAGPLDPAETEQRARVTVGKIASQLGRSSNWVAAALEAIADTLTFVGVSKSREKSRASRIVNLLQDCCSGVAEWSSKQQSSDQASYVELVCSVADFTLSLADTILAQARALTNDMGGLLRSWAANPDPIIHLAGRSEWLLDGWEQICLLWCFAKDDVTRRAALVEMAQLVPILPREVREWSDLFLEAEVSMRLRRLIPLNEDWRTGATVFNLVARNERIRAATC